MMGGYDLLDYWMVYITPKKDSQTNYIAVAEWYKDSAVVIKIGKDEGNQNINPLQVMLNDNIINSTNYDYVNQFNNHLELVMAFFRVLDTSGLMDNYVHESLMEIYRRHGIVRKDPSTWKNLSGDKWPVLLDLRELWKEDAKNKNVSAEAMVNRTTWLETTCEYISRPTDVKFNKPIIIIDLSGVPKVLEDSMNVLVVGMIGMRFNTNSTKKTFVFIDEGRVFLNDKHISELIMRIFTQGGSHGLYACFTTQEPGDVNSKEAQELLQTNSFVKIAMGNAQQQSYKTIQDFFGLSDDHMEEYAGCSQGQGMVMVNDSVTAVDFKLTDLESHIILGTEKPGEKTGTDIGFEYVDNRFKILAENNHAYIENWIKGDPKLLSPGRTRYSVQRAFKAGTTGIWIRNLDTIFKSKRRQNHEPDRRSLRNGASNCFILAP